MHILFIPSSKHPLISELAYRLNKSNHIKVDVLYLPPPLRKMKKLDTIKKACYFSVCICLHDPLHFLKIICLLFKHFSFKNLKFFVWTFVLSIMIFEENLKKRYDLIHAFWAYPAGFAAMLVKRLIKVPITISVLGYDIDEHTLNNPLLKEITTFTLREADHIIIGAKNHYFNVLLLGIPKHKITILSMPVPTEKFSPHINRKIVRELYGIKDYEILVGFGPRISKFYGAIDFIKAALLSSKKASNIIFMILGENTIGKPLEDYLKRNNVKIIFTGEIPYDNMPYYYAAMDIYCNLCYGGQGISTLEAMSSKKLVIGYNIGDIKITNEVDGILVQPGNIKQLAEKILTAAKNKDLREKIAENARKRVLAHNNMSTYIDKLVYIYMKFRISK